MGIQGVTSRYATQQEDLAGSAGNRDILGQYLNDASVHPLLKPHEERELLKRLVEARNDWVSTYLRSEPALEAIWADLKRWEAGEIAAVSLVPGPPRLKPGQLGPEDFVTRLHGIFAAHVRARGQRPFKVLKRNRVERLLWAVHYVGLRPGPLERYRAVALEQGTPALKRRVAEARARFLDVRRPLVERNLRLVLKVARKFVPGPMPFTDLIQEGNLGLIRATESFNGRFGVRFSTYAYLWIRQAILRALENKSRTIRLPVNLTQALRRLNRKLGTAETEQEAAASGNDVPDRLREVMRNPTVSGPVLSLDQGPDEDSSMVEVVPDEQADRPYGSVVSEDLRGFVRNSLSLLPDRERLILRLRFGIDIPRAYTLGEIGRLLGLSAERIRQIQESAFCILREGPDGHLLRELVLD